MYKCDCCRGTTTSREKQNKVATYKDVSYEHFKVIFNEKTKKKEREYFTTTGQEIVNEQNYCDDCFKRES